MANNSIHRRRFIREVILASGGAVVGIAAYKLSGIKVSFPTEQPVIGVPTSEGKIYSTLEELAADVGQNVSEKYVYCGKLPERRYDEVDYDFLDSMQLGDVVMKGPDTTKIREKIQNGINEAVKRMPADKQHIMKDADLDRDARLYLKYIPEGHGDPSSETYDPLNRSDLAVSVAVYNHSGEIIKRPFAPISLKDLTCILNPDSKKEITWQVADDTRMVYNRKLAE